MFSNLSKGSILHGLDTKEDKYFTASIENVSLPFPKYRNNTFGQLPEMVVDIVALIGGERREFKQVPSNSTIADFGPNTIVLADSKDSLANYVRSLRQISQTAVDNYPMHKEKIPKYDKILSEIEPGNVNESVVKELREQVGSLQSQLAEALSLLKGENANKKEKL